MTPHRKSSRPAGADSLSIELGRWFRAHATGRGVLAIPLVIALLAGIELVRVLHG